MEEQKQQKPKIRPLKPEEGEQPPEPQRKLPRFLVRALAALVVLAAALSLAGLALLVAGGICYTGGIVFYAIKKPYMHGIWHLFVLAGSVCHFLCVLLDVIL